MTSAIADARVADQSFKDRARQAGFTQAHAGSDHYNIVDCVCTREHTQVIGARALHILHLLGNNRPAEERGASTAEAVITRMRHLITYLPDAWPWLSSALALGLPRFLRELGRLRLASTVKRLADAVIKHDEWNEERFEQVVHLIDDMYHDPGPRRSALKRRPTEAEPPTPLVLDQSPGRWSADIKEESPALHPPRYAGRPRLRNRRFRR